MHQFTQNLQYWMKKRGMNQTDLAAATGFHRTTIQRWVSGRRVPTVDRAEKLRQALRVSEHQFNKGVQLNAKY